MKTKKKWILIFPIIGILIGLSVLLYPFIMDRINDQRNARAISSMSSVYDRYEDHAAEIEEQLMQAKAYNLRLAGCDTDPAMEIWDYEDQLTFDGDGVMGYIEIPKINVRMMIYHGTADETLAVGAGHLEGSSLPVGGKSAHSVITAHSGMKTMKAFDELRKLEEGDLFAVTVLGTQYVYEVESVETVLPWETESLAIVPGEDRMTLITCTPYGINDHRLLVHGVRTEKEISKDDN